MGKERDYRISNIRALAIMIVVLGHSIIIYDTNWGYYTAKYQSEMLQSLKHIINYFQMPLFFFDIWLLLQLFYPKDQKLRLYGICQREGEAFARTICIDCNSVDDPTSSCFKISILAGKDTEVDIVGNNIRV